MTTNKKPKQETTKKGLNSWLILRKPGGGRVAMWPANIVGVEEYNKPPCGFNKTKTAPSFDTFVHSNDFSEPVQVATSFEDTLEAVTRKWREEHGEEDENEEPE